MARITTLAGMKGYIKSVLGEPVIQVEIADAQLNRIIDDTIQIYQKYGTGEGNYQDFLAFPVTVGTSAYSTEGWDLASVIDFDLSYSNDGINVLFSPQHQLLYQDWVIHGNYPGGPGGYASQSSGMVLAGYEVAMEYLNDISDMFDLKIHAQYTDARQEILLYPTPSTSGTALLTVYRKTSAQELYNDDLVKRLAVAEAKIQWGNNLNKYNMTLPHGGTINGSDILTQGKEEKEKVMDDIVMESEAPNFFIE